MTDPTATYVYCVARAPKRPRLGRGVRGIPELGPPRVLDAGGGVWLVVANAPLERFGEAALGHALKDLDWVSRCALGHEAVVEKVAGAQAVLPLKLLTLFHSDERAKGFVEQDRQRLLRTLDKVEGHSELGVRLGFDPKAAARAKPAPARVAQSSGAAFLRRKKEAKDAAVELAEHARAEADLLFAELSKLAKDARRRPEVERAQGSRVLLDAVFLVAAKKLPRFRSHVQRSQKTLGARGYQLTLNGPWPPYHFAVDAA